MAFYREHVYPKLVSALGNPQPIEKIRRHMIPGACGTVLEIGVGPGVNFRHYDRTRVNKVFALEPNPGMIWRAEQERSQAKLDIEFLELPGERIPLADGTVDTVVSTFTLCTIPGLVQAIQGIGRVLKSGGQLIFFEHGLSPEPRVQRWQQRVEPLFRLAFEGCHVTRDIPLLIRRGGFNIQQIEAGYLAAFPKAASYCWWGVAVPDRESSPAANIVPGC